MFEHHRKSPWFAEKYDPSPELVQMRARVRKVGWQDRLDSFLLDLEAGKFDPDLNEAEPVPEHTSSMKETSTNGDASAANGADSSILNAAPVPTEETKANGTGEEEMQFGAEGEDEGGDQEANRGETNGGGKQSLDAKRAANRGEEISIPPEGNQVMIRTIPPDIGRLKLEEVGTSSAVFLHAQSNA